MLADSNVTNNRIILMDGQVTGSIACHAWFGEAEVSYGPGQEFWGRGAAMPALALFLAEAPTRPIHARIVKDNVASQWVLERNGFTV